MCQFMPSTFFNGIYNPGDWKGASKQDNTKANYTHKKEKLPLSSLAPSMVARQPNSSVFQGVQLVRLFPYHRYSERPQCIVGFSAPETESSSGFCSCSIISHSKWLRCSLVAAQCSCVGVIMHAQQSNHAWIKLRYLEVCFVFLFFSQARSLIGNK